MLAKGTTIGQYEILDDQPLARGSGTFIYRVRHIASSKVFVCKILIEALTPDQRQIFIGQLKKELSAIKQLDHPNIIKLIEGSLDNLTSRYIYLILEYLDGSNILSDVIDKRIKLSPSEIAEIFIQYTKALDYSHKSKIFHGDISPQNILFKRIQSGFQVKIIDFGLARIENLLQQTVRGSAMFSHAGTDEYAAPERVLKDRSPNKRTDIYSLGMVLYHAISGKLPFKIGYNVRSAVNAFHLSGKTPRFPTVDIPNASRVQQGLAYVAMKAISRRPLLRFSSMAQMSKSLEKAKDGRIDENTVFIKQFEAIWLNVLSVPLGVFTTIAFQKYSERFGFFVNIITLLIIACLLSVAFLGILLYFRTAIAYRLILVPFGVITALAIALGSGEVPKTVEVSPAQIPSFPSTVGPSPTSTPTATHTSTPTETPTPTKTPNPSATPTPKPTPLGLEGITKLGPLQVKLADYEFRPEQHPDPGAIKFVLDFINTGNTDIEVRFDVQKIVGYDNAGNQFVEFYSGFKSYFERNCISLTGGYDWSALVQDLKVAPGDSTNFTFYLNPIGTKGCSPESFKGRVPFGTDWVEFELPIDYHIVGSSSESTTLKWRMVRN